MEDQLTGRSVPVLSPVVIITGEGDQGQGILAMSTVEAALEAGQLVLHNGCCNEGLTISDEALLSDERMAELMNFVPGGSLFVLKDADCIPALISTPTPTEAIWLKTCKAKDHMMVLTTVRGREYRLKSAIERAETSHVFVEAAHARPGLFVRWASGELLERLTVGQVFYPHDKVVEWAKLTDGSYEEPYRPPGELILNYPRSIIVPSDYGEAVRSTETPKPKHPSYPFLLTRTVKHSENRRVRLTEVIGMIWQESINKYRDEEVAITTIEWACEKWGIHLNDSEFVQGSAYPDGRGTAEGEAINIEVTKVQPKWPSGAPLSALADGTRAGKVPVRVDVPTIICKECGTCEAPDLHDVHVIPQHDENHVWTCVYPGRMITPDWYENLTILPELRIDSGLLETAIAERVCTKSSRARKFGRGKQNWLVLLVEGFPPIEGFASVIRDVGWEDFDGVFAIMTEAFLSAIHGFSPDDLKKIVVLKCPEHDRHTCYHPGMTMVNRKADWRLDSLREQPADKGIVYQTTSSDGTLLAEWIEELPQPTTEADLRRGLISAKKRLPYQPPTPWG